MKSPLHILHLEDDPNDAALIQSTLEAEGIACAITRVQNRDDFVAALEKRRHRLDSFGFLAARVRRVVRHRDRARQMAGPAVHSGVRDAGRGTGH